MNRKLRKLFRNPKAFWRDSRLNIKNRWIKNIKEDSPDNNNSILMKPIEKDFDIYFLLNKLKIPAIYIEPLSNKSKFAICILKEEKENFFKKFLNVIYYEGLSVKYKHNGKLKAPVSVNEFFYDMSMSKFLDIRIHTERCIKCDPIWFRLEFWEKGETYYYSPVDNHISRRLYFETAKRYDIFEKDEVQNYSIILSKTHEFKNDFKVDLVFTWVNSDDPGWQKLYQKYCKEYGLIKNKEDEKKESVSISRFKNRDELKYSLRSWEKYGSFINNIYIVSNCEPPEWIDLENPKIHWIYHEEILPENVLPTFNSHAIETSLHKIKGLSNYFIYCNDDIVLTRPSESNDFFYSNGIIKLKLEKYGNVNGKISENDPDYLNAARNGVELLEQSFSRTPTQLHTHSPQGLRVDILNELEEKYIRNFKMTQKNKFRSINDISVTSFLFQHYAYMTGRAVDTDIETLLIKNDNNFKNKFNKVLKLRENKRPLSVCINDGADSHLNESWNEEVLNFLNTLFPEPSKYEKK